MRNIIILLLFKRSSTGAHLHSCNIEAPIPSGSALKIPTSILRDQFITTWYYTQKVDTCMALHNKIYGNLSSLWDLTDLIISKDIVSAYCHY